MVYNITVEVYRTFAFRVEADCQAEAERLGREVMGCYHPDTDDVTVQARAAHTAALEVVK